MTGTPADFVYGRFALTEIPADGEIIPLDSLLIRLYSADVALPRFESRYALLPDSVVLDLRKTTGGSPWLRQQALAVLDMASSAMADTMPSQRPLLMINGLPSRQRAGLDSLMIPGLFASRLGGPDRLTQALTAAASLKDLADGGCFASKRPYYDPATARLMRWQRAGLLRTASLLVDSARYDEASLMTLKAIRLWPFEVVPPDFINVGTSAVHESHLAGELLRKSGKARGDAVAVGLGDQLEVEYRERLIAWQRYYRSLSPRMRRLTSDDCRRHVHAATSSQP